MQRQSALLASRRITTQMAIDEETSVDAARSARVASKRVSTADLDASQPLARAVKKVKRPDKCAAPSDLHARLLSTVDASCAPATPACHFPLRQHSLTYHRPLLLHGRVGTCGRAALLSWYDGASANRAMPWRKPFLNPADYSDSAQLRQALTQRAYEVFISEIMLQQTRVATVIDYWNRWMDRWPTIHDLAKADEDDVMGAWRGLGYYSRCKRILEACRKVVQHSEWDGLMPSDAKELEAQLPGVGPYTAGAISSIVFGRPAPMVDGNVLRVLSRQLGLLGDTKSDKTIVDLVWATARSLVRTIAAEATAEATADDEGAGTDDPKPNDGPGRWGQALMELGSTVCTPRPDCSACPVSVTCRAYQEGTTLAGRATEPAQPLDIEDVCQLCEPFVCMAAPVVPVKASPANKSKQATLSSFCTAPTPNAPRKAVEKDVSPETLKIIASHAQRFPVKPVKKALREQETLVCAIWRVSDGMYLLQKRPGKGLLAGMWEFPSDVLPGSNDSSAAARKSRAWEFVTGLFTSDGASTTPHAMHLEHAGDLGSVPWAFSHLKLTMHVHLFRLDSSDEVPLADSPDARRWVTPDGVEAETMGTGMRQCWRLVAESAL